MTVFKMLLYFLQEFLKVFGGLILTKKKCFCCFDEANWLVTLLEVEFNYEIVKDHKGGKIHTKPTQKDVEGSENITEVSKLLFDKPEQISECEYKKKPSESL